MKTAEQIMKKKAVIKAECFQGQHALGWVLAATALLLFPAAFFYGARDGARQDFTFWQFAFRFAVMLYLLKAFDILVFDWILRFVYIIPVVRIN